MATTDDTETKKKKWNWLFYVWVFPLVNLVNSRGISRWTDREIRVSYDNLLMKKNNISCIRLGYWPVSWMQMQTRLPGKFSSRKHPITPRKQKQKDQQRGCSFATWNAYFFHFQVGLKPTPDISWKLTVYQNETIFFLKITISQRQEERAIKSCDELFGNRESLCYFFPPLSLILQRYGGLLCIKEGKDDCEKSKHEHVYSAAFFHICSYKFRILTNKVGKKITDSNKEKGACGLFQV